MEGYVVIGIKDGTYKLIQKLGLFRKTLYMTDHFDNTVLRPLNFEDYIRSYKAALRLADRVFNSAFYSLFNKIEVCKAHVDEEKNLLVIEEN